MYFITSILKFSGAPARMKPQMVLEYNRFKLSVDRLDQRMSYYQFARKSVTWWRKVFFWRQRNEEKERWEREREVGRRERGREGTSTEARRMG